MKNMKKILLGGVLFSCISVMNAQSKSVGINTDNPTQTLDVSGTMGISNIGKARDGQNIYWNQKTGQWIKGPNKIGGGQQKVYYVSYAVHLSKNGDDYANLVPLGINPQKYEAILTQSFLVKTGSGEGKKAQFYYDSTVKDRLPPLVVAPYVANNGGIDGHMKIVNGYINNQDEEAYSQQGYIAIPQKDVYLKKTDDDYQLYADYRGVTPDRADLKYTWVITLLVIDKTWTKEFTTN